MIGIVAHQSRSGQAYALKEQVGAVYLSMDNGQWGCEANHRRTWEWLAGKPSEWAVVLEDDAVPVPGFNQQVEQALSVAPSPIVSLYLGRLRPPHWQTAIEDATERANRAGSSWITATHLLHAVAVAIRTDLIPDMLTHTAASRRPWDYAIAAWALAQGHAISYTVPSLCDHEDGPSVIVKHPDKMARLPGRKAWQVGARDVWTPDTVTMKP